MLITALQCLNLVVGLFVVKVGWAASYGLGPEYSE